ncbi:MAG: 50S ribosomal protein L11 methyltransferase [Deltaproteobacteria bacterium]|nr:MAG: 50S ribosomal protein L11 methyltransferase [Deltaproteobacteria bacterium]
MLEESSDEDKWVSLRVRSPVLVREALANFLLEQSGRGLEQDGEWITAYCRPGTDVQECLQALSRYYDGLRQLHPNLPELEVIQRDLRAENWSEAWKTFFKPILVGNAIVVKPTWEFHEATAEQVVIEMDPGRAFGTGRHPSTALSIELLEYIFNDLVPGVVSSEPSVLDVGTGSGILGIVAARLGAERVMGLDLDPEALEVAAGNLNRNGVGAIMSVSATPLEQVQETFNVVVANLTAALIIHISKDLARRVSSAGLLLLAGFLTEQVEEVNHCFRSYGFELLQSRSREDWWVLLFVNSRQY